MMKKLYPLALFGAVCLGALSDNSAHAAFKFTNKAGITDISVRVTVSGGAIATDAIPNNESKELSLENARIQKIAWVQGGYDVVNCLWSGDITLASTKSFILVREKNRAGEEVPTCKEETGK